MKKQRFTCPVCGGGSRWPTDVYLDHLEDNLRGFLKWDEPRIQKTLLRLEDEGLIRRTARGGAQQPTEPWLDTCEPCAVGQQRCETCHAIMAVWTVGEKLCSRCYNKSIGIKPRPADTQRAKVYHMEWRIFRGAYAVNVSVVEANALLKRLARRFHVETPGLKNMPGNGSRAGDYRFGRIRAQGVNRDRVCVGIVIHEFAHHLTEAYHPREVAHGAAFVRCLYEAMGSVGYPPTCPPSRERWKVKIGHKSDFTTAAAKARALRM